MKKARMPIDGKLLCSFCDLYISVDEFYKTTLTKSGYCYECKSCKATKAMATPGRKRRKYRVIVNGKLLCSKCDLEMSVNYFRVDKRYSCGRSQWCKDCLNKSGREYCARNKNKISHDSKMYIARTKLTVMSHYCNGTPRCMCCGIDHIDFLTIDHIDNDGAQWRRNATMSIYRWIVKNNFPRGLQVLCFNCNCTKGFFGSCPHKRIGELRWHHALSL